MPQTASTTWRSTPNRASIAARELCNAAALDRPVATRSAEAAPSRYSQIGLVNSAWLPSSRTTSALTPTPWKAASKTSGRIPCASARPRNAARHSAKLEYWTMGARIMGGVPSREASALTPQLLTRLAARTAPMVLRVIGTVSCSIGLVLLRQNSRGRGEHKARRRPGRPRPRTRAGEADPRFPAAAACSKARRHGEREGPRMTALFARIVAMIGAAAILMRRWGASPEAPAIGDAPTIPEAKPQGVPTLKMPTARGWSAGQAPTAAPGLKVNAFAAGLKHPRWIYVLPNGDVLTAEALTEPGGVRTAFDYAIYATMKRAAAVGPSPNRITLLRDADGDGVAEMREPFLVGLNQPFGMALLGDDFYVGNTDGVVAFPYADGATRITAAGRRVADFKPGGHWTRSLLAESGRAAALCRGRLAQQHRRERHGGRGGPRLRLRARSRDRRGPGLRVRPAQPRGPRLGTELRRALDRGERTRRARRRDAARLPHLAQGRRLLRLALLLLGQDRRRPRAAGPGHGRRRADARLRPRRPHRLAGPVLGPGRRAAGFRRWHGHRPARLVEPQHAGRIPGDLRPLRRLAARPARRATSSPASSPPTRRRPTAGRWG